MVLARVGGVLLILGSVLTGIAVATGSIGGGPAGPGEDRVNAQPLVTALVAACSGLLGAGAGVVGIAAPPPLRPRLTRVGLGFVAIGLLSLALGLIVPIPPGSNSLASWGIYPVLGGGAASAIGWLVTAASLVRSPGGPRVVGLVLLGAVLVVLLPLLGWALLILGCAGVGLLALGVGVAGDGAPA